MKIIASISEKVHHLNIRKQFYSIFHLEPSLTYLKDFQFLKNLTSFNLYLSFKLPQPDSTIFLNDLYSHLALLTNLKNLNLSFDSFKHPSHILVHLQSLIKLEQLHLNFANCFDINNDFLKALAKILPNFHHLQDFRLILSSKDISPESLMPLFSAFRQLSSLRTLTLNLYRANINKRSLKILAHSIAPHLNLTTIDLTLGRPQKPKSFLQRFARL